MSYAVDVSFRISVMLAALLASGHALIFNREARSAALWVIVIWVLPALGPILYLVLGINRVERRAARLRRRVERYRSVSEHPPGEPGTHLAPLARLVGEVVQRPASAVKELIENSIDADATQFRLILKEAGKTLLQIIDNGKGMSETDARMSLERHATSKIRKAEDLFTLRTMGFRGEALASIAAVSQMEMKTRLPGQELGTLLVVEGSEVKRKQPV